MATEISRLPSTEELPRLAHPTIADGRELWQMARESKTLDLNSPYAYTLWCRDFAATSVVAHGTGGPCGFIIGYARPSRPDTLFVWQVAVARSHRGQGLARRMLGELATGRRYVEATVTPGNEPSTRLFESFARERDTALTRSPIFTEDHFPTPHEPEVLFRIGPLA
ncbi:diaminobutyrate acetyltransferase [Actinomadura craniellae]|nr:diaminobutyrate acetyltransferase [Actinomadura craniellae]